MTKTYLSNGEPSTFLLPMRRVCTQSIGLRRLRRLADDVTLDRVPPKEQSWGGYAGLSVRFAKDLTQRQAISTVGNAEFGEGDRHRSRATAMDYSGLIDGKAVGLGVSRSSRQPSSSDAVVRDSQSRDELHQRVALGRRATGAAIPAKDDAAIPSGRPPHRWDAERLEAAYIDFSPSPSTTESR